MTALGPMLATLMTMTPGGHSPIACEADSLGVTIRLGDRIHFFVELPRVCELDAPQDADASPSRDIPDLLDAVLASGGLTADDDTDTDPQANVAVTTDDEPADTAVAEATNTEEDVTLQQIAELDERNSEAAPEESSETASADDASASAQDEDGADEEQPIASDSAETQEVAPAEGDAASVDTESITGPTGLDLVSGDRQIWLERFDRVRDEVRDAFRSLLP